MNADNAVVVSNLTKHFDKLVAVDHISFQVKEGELFGFLGPNGAGKTTTIRMLTGVIKPDGGTASIFGHGYPKRKTERQARQLDVSPML